MAGWGGVSNRAILNGREIIGVTAIELTRWKGPF